MNFDLRLVGGEDGSEGRLEICHDNVWGRVCNSYGRWTIRSAGVVCRQLGLPIGRYVYCVTYTLTKLPKTNVTRICNCNMDSNAEKYSME